MPRLTGDELGTGAVRVPRGSALRRLGKAANRALKRRLRRLLGRLWPSDGERSIEVASVRRILFVRVNFRVGNTVLSTARLEAIRERFPDATIDFLAADATACLLEGLGLRRVHTVSRHFLVAPWRFVTLVRRLRRAGYDLAVDGGLTSFSGALYASLSGARHRLGAEGPGSRLLTTRLRLERRDNVYERAGELGRALGVEGEPWPVYRVSESEDEQALQTLADLDLVGGGDAVPFVAVFVGGYREKRWPGRSWKEIVERLDAESIPAVVFVGPEERTHLASLRESARRSVRVIAPKPLRSFAALLARASLLVTTDSGPMHLAAALGVPVLALVNTERSLDFVPPRDRMLFRPSPTEIVDALHAHPAWPRIAPPTDDWEAPLPRAGSEARR